MKNNLLYSLVIVVIFLVAGFFLINQTAQNIKPEDIKYVKIAGQNIKVALALTPDKREQGLSGQSALLDNQGLLFIFDQPGKYFFWMKDMNFPIDMIWISQELKVVYIKKDATPLSYPETYGPNIDAKYVLEIASGFSDKNGLKEGDGVLFTY